MTDRPSAPASTQARAISVMSVTSGESLAKTGTPCEVLRRTASTTSADGAGSQAKTWPRSSTLGQEMFTSTIATPGAAAQLLREQRVLLDAAAGDRHDGAGAAAASQARSLLEEGVDARALQADRVDHAARASRPCAASRGPTAAPA